MLCAASSPHWPRSSHLPSRKSPAQFCPAISNATSTSTCLARWARSSNECAPTTRKVRLRGLKNRRRPVSPFRCPRFQPPGSAPRAASSSASPPFAPLCRRTPCPSSSATTSIPPPARKRRRRTSSSPRTSGNRPSIGRLANEFPPTTRKVRLRGLKNRRRPVSPFRCPRFQPPGKSRRYAGPDSTRRR